MAEAVVDGAPISRFFCHKCTVEIEHLLPDYTCPQCACGFIEELESGGNDSSSGMDISSEDVSDIDIPLREVHNVQRQLLDMLRLSFLHGFNALQQTGTDSIGQLGNNGGGMRARRLHFRPRTRSQGNRQNRDDVGPTIESVIQDFILQRYPMMQVGPSPVLFLGNPGDYVWGRDGLDAIVTQLLNQMDGTGPPPLPRKQIDEIPTTFVSKTQVDCKLQCSVCWEDFLLAEPVRLLPCQHVYHELCIVPWLELHGTCPICRQSLGDQNSAEANQDTVGPSLAALFRAANESSSSRPESTSSARSDSSDD